MTDKVCCVFQKLPGETCPTLAAVCRTRAVAESVCAAGRREAHDSGEPEGEWFISEWTVLDRKTERQAERAADISHVLDPMRGGLAVTEDGNED